LKKIALILLIFGFLLGLVSCKNAIEPTIEDTHPYETLEGGWKLIFYDEFDQTELDTDVWTAANTRRHGSDTVFYANRKENVDVIDGKLVLTSIETKQEELYLFEGMPYTSARLETKGKFDFTYGRIIVSAKLAGGEGTWPAIWMLPTENVYGNWPRSGEIDIMEYYGKRPTIVSAAYHTEKYNHMNTAISTIARNRTIADAETAFHTFELIWTPTSLSWFFNGQSVHFYRYNNRLEGMNDHYSQAWPFDQNFHLIINLGMGDAGGSGGGYINPDDLPTSLEVDYVRVYQLDAETHDLTPPTAPEYLEQSNINPRYFLWPRAEDDLEVSHYELKIDDTIVGTTPVNSYLFDEETDLSSKNIYVRAVDFMNRTSDWTLLESDDE